MAILKDGAFIGKIGTIVGCTWKGKHYVRRIPVRTAAPTQREIENRYAFNLVNEWLKPIHDFVRLGFRNYSPTVSGINAACSMLHKTALTRDGMNSSIDASLVQVSFGELELPAELQLVQESDSLLLTWNPQSGLNKGSHDRLIILAYDPETGWAKQEFSASQRYTGSYSLPLLDIPPGGYHGNDACSQTGSRYLGKILKE